MDFLLHMVIIWQTDDDDGEEERQLIDLQLALPQVKRRKIKGQALSKFHGVPYKKYCVYQILLGSLGKSKLYNIFGAYFSCLIFYEIC